MKKIILTVILTAVLVTCTIVTGIGYLFGNYFVHFGLERGTKDNPKEPPRAYALLMPPEAREFAKPDYPSEPWDLTSTDGLHLAATHFSPKEGRMQEPERWAIVVHGYGCTQQNSYYIAEHYLHMGYHVLTPDLRAAGDSEGRYLTLGVRESEDIVLWARKIARERPHAKILMHGVSMGAATVMLAAGRDDLPRELVACVEDCGYTSAYDLLALQVEESFGLPAFPAMNLLDWRCVRLAKFRIKDAAPIEAVRHAHVPILFIHGKKDTLVPNYMMDLLYDAANAPQKATLLIPGANHAASSQVGKKLYFKTIRDFVRPYMDKDERK